MRQVLRKLWLLALFGTMSVTNALADATVGTAAELKSAIEELSEDGQTITLSAKITLTEAITASHSFTLDLGGKSITKGSYSIALGEGVTVKTSSSSSVFTTSVEGKQVCVERLESGYSYTVATAVAKKSSYYFTSLEKAITYNTYANGFSTTSYTVELLADVTMTSDVECILIGSTNYIYIKQGNYTLTPNGHKITLKRDIYGYTDKAVDGLFAVSESATGCELVTLEANTSYAYRYRCLYKYEAKIGDTDYETFAAAAEAATSEQVIVPMRSGIEYNLVSGKTIKVKRVGCTVEGSQHSYSLTVKAPAGEYAISKTSEKDDDGIYIDTYSVDGAAVAFTNAQGTTTYSMTLSTLGSNGTYKLLKDISVTVSIVTGTLASDVTVDLNGHTLTNTAASSSSNYCFGLLRTNQKLTITDSSEGKTGKVVANNCIFVNGSGNELNIEAAIEVTGDCAIATNGSTTTSGTINIKEGAKLTSDNICMYLPGKADVSITAGTISGTTGIYQKSGTLNITGGTIIGTGAAADYTYNGNGANSTGDAVVIDNCGYPGGAPVPSITGGTFESTNADPIATYVKEDNAELTAVTGFVSGGTFSSELPANVIVADKICPSESNVEGGKFELTTGTYVAQVGDYGYETFAKAVTAADGTEVITLLATVDDAYPMAEGETLRVEKGEYSLTVEAAPTGFSVKEEVADGVTTYSLVDNTITLTEEDGITALTAKAGATNVPVTLTRTFESGLDYGTVCFPFPITVPASTAGTYHEFSSVDADWKVHMSAAKAEGTVLTANKPYLFQPAASGEITFGGTIAEVAESYTPTADTKSDWSFEGTYEQITWDSADKFGNSTAVYAFMAASIDPENPVEVGAFKKLGTNGSITKPFRAVMKYNPTSGSRTRGGDLPDMLTVVIDNADGTTTKIGTIGAEANGGEWYTLDGRKLSGKPAKKGVYVNNGQKVVIR